MKLTQKDYQKKYYQTNQIHREKCILNSREYYSKNREEILGKYTEYKKEYYSTKREEIKKKNLERYYKTKEDNWLFQIKV